MATRKRAAYVVPHTHWDREWYLPFHRFRVRLVDVIDRVLDVLESDPAFRHFVLDGQAVVLEDYLEARPEAAPRIERLVKSGALSVGPWYVLPDEFLVSGESTARNLLYGHEVAAAFGPVQKVGYMPDSFGHIAQMPQLLSEAGIDSFIYTRGNGDELEKLGLEYVWRAPDGSEALAVNQWHGYCNAAALGFKEIWHAWTLREPDPELAVDRVRALLGQMETRSNADVLLLNNGCDHHPPQRRLADIIEALSRALPDVEFRVGSFRDYVDALRASKPKLRTFEGELLGGRYHHILSGVWSARVGIKQKNAEAQTMLAGYLEPLASYVHFALGRPYPSGLIDTCWKLLLRNHPHDSICGCSTDDVERDMRTRFAGVCQTGEQLLSSELERIAPVFARRPEDDHDTVICVANPLPFRRSEIVERLVVFQPPGADTHRLRLFDEQGSPVPFTVVSKHYVERFWGVDYRGEIFSSRQGDLFRKYVESFGDRILRTEAENDASDCFLTIQFVARDLPATGHANYYLTHEPARTGPGTCQPPSPVWGVRVGENTLENDLVRVVLHHNGTLDLKDKSSGAEYQGLNVYEDSEDVGDEYDYSPAPNSLTLTSLDTFGDVRTLRDTGLEGVLEVRYTLHLPSGVERDRDHRRPDTAACRMATRVRLRHGSPLVEIETDLDNRAKDHRLRAVFRTPLRADSVVSDGHFMFNKRPIEGPAGADWVEPPPTTHPQQDFTLIADGARAFAVINSGLPEIEARRSDDGGTTLKLTLLRAVGWLSRDDFVTRKRSNAGPMLHTPGAQCLGSHSFRYALLSLSGEGLEPDAREWSLRYHAPVLTKQGVRDACVAGGVGLLEKRSRLTCVSAVKKHRIRDTLVVRLYNMSGQTVEEELTLFAPPKAAWRTNLLEERLDEVAVGEGRRQVGLSLGPHRIETFEFEFENDVRGGREDR
jgi:mannosylglycerate hydrolase